MAVVNPPSWLQAGSYSARLDRLGIGSFLASPGVASLSAYTVTATPTPSMSVLVSAGEAFVQNNYSTAQGYYCAVNDGAVTIPLDASHANFSRIDAIILRIYDAQYSGTDNKAEIEKVTGNPSPVPSIPTIPNNSIILATVRVPALVSSINSTNIDTSTRQMARIQQTMTNAVQEVRSVQLPPDPYPGQMVVEKDTNILRAFIGGTWRIISPTIAENYTSTTRPASSLVYSGMIIFEKDTKKYYTWDGVRWNYLSGGGGDIQTTSFTAWNPEYTQPAGLTAAFSPMTLWKDAEGRMNIEGHVRNAIDFYGWTQYGFYGLAYLPSSAYYPAKDIQASTVAIAHNVGHVEAVVSIKGTAPGSILPGGPGIIMWQPNISSSWSVPNGWFKLSIPRISWKFEG